MKEVAEAIVTKWNATDALKTAAPGGIVCGTHAPGTARPRVSFRVWESSPASTNTTRNDYLAVVMAAFTGSCEDDTQAHELADLLLAHMPEVAGVVDFAVQGRTVDELDIQEDDGETVWEATLLLQYTINRKRK